MNAGKNNLSLGFLCEIKLRIKCMRFLLVRKVPVDALPLSVEMAGTQVIVQQDFFRVKMLRRNS